MTDASIPLDDFPEPLGTWRRRLQRPAKKFAQQSFDAAADPLSSENRARIEEWIGASAPITVAMASNASPIDLLEAGNALRIAGTVALMARIRAAALKHARLIDPKFTPDGISELAYLARLVSALLADPRLMTFTSECERIFEIDDDGDVASFIASHDYQDNGHYLFNYADLTELAERVRDEHDKLLDDRED